MFLLVIFGQNSRRDFIETRCISQAGNCDAIFKLGIGYCSGSDGLFMELYAPGEAMSFVTVWGGKNVSYGCD